MSERLAARRLSSLRSAMEPIIGFLEEDSILEVMLNPDGRIWVDEIGSGMRLTGVTMTPADAERMIRLIAASMEMEVNSRNPSLGAKLPHWGARVQATIPPIVEAPVFALRKPAKLVFSLSDYTERGIMSEREADIILRAVDQRKNMGVYALIVQMSLRTLSCADIARKPIKTISASSFQGLSIFISGFIGSQTSRSTGSFRSGRCFLSGFGL